MKAASTPASNFSVNTTFLKSKLCTLRLWILGSVQIVPSQVRFSQTIPVNTDAFFYTVHRTLRAKFQHLEAAIDSAGLPGRRVLPPEEVAQRLEGVRGCATRDPPVGSAESQYAYIRTVVGTSILSSYLCVSCAHASIHPSMAWTARRSESEREKKSARFSADQMVELSIKRQDWCQLKLWMCMRINVPLGKCIWQAFSGPFPSPGLNFLQTAGLNRCMLRTTQGTSDDHESYNNQSLGHGRRPTSNPPQRSGLDLSSADYAYSYREEGSHTGRHYSSRSLPHLSLAS